VVDVWLPAKLDPRAVEAVGFAKNCLLASQAIAADLADA
jgi:hypothetical protein